MMQQPATQTAEAAEMLADLSSLSRQVGSTEGLSALGSVSALLNIDPVRDVRTLRHFLSQYESRILAPVELPLIYRAYTHTLQNEARELIQLDRSMEHEMYPPELATPSRCVGQRQLRRLRPLRDHRVVQRYLASVEESKAFGWHTLVYGMILAVYGVPLRQGLLNYAQQTQLGFLTAAGQSLLLSRCDVMDLEEEALMRLQPTVESWFHKQAVPSLRVL